MLLWKCMGVINKCSFFDSLKDKNWPPKFVSIKIDFSEVDIIKNNVAITVVKDNKEVAK